MMSDLQRGYWCTLYKTMFSLVIFSSKLTTLESASCSTNYEFVRKLPMDIRSDDGVWTDKIPGSRVEYNPFPAHFHISPGHNVKIEFKTSDPDGLLFMIGDFNVGDLVAAMLSEGHLSFLRHCDSGHTFERYTKKFNDNKWHKLEFIHSRQGGEILIDDVNPFREYHIGPCTDFSSIIFGGIAPDMTLESVEVVSFHPYSYELQGDDTYHRFRGCMRKMRIDGKIAVIHPKHIAVSACQD